ncbi:MAG: HEAT repeat domain-containing protein [Armatimonadota bacterium]
MRARVVTLLGVVAVMAALTGCKRDPIEDLSDQLESLKLEERLAAIEELKNFAVETEDERAIELLIEALETDEDVTEQAGNALVVVGRALKDPKEKPDKVPELLARTLANSHLESAVRAKAAWALGEIGDREAIPALKAGKSAVDAKGAAAGDVRTASAIALEKLGYTTKASDWEIPPGGERPEKTDA